MSVTASGSETEGWSLLRLLFPHLITQFHKVRHNYRWFQRAQDEFLKIAKINIHCIIKADLSIMVSSSRTLCWAFNLKLLAGPVSPISVPVLSLSCSIFSPIPHYCVQESSNKWSKYLGSLPSMQEIQMKLLVPGFCLAQPWLLWSFGKWTNKWRSSLFTPFPCVCVCVFSNLSSVTLPLK